jgi:hypothetical protein
MQKDPFFDYHVHQLSLPDHVLRDLARNECAEKSYRKNAVEILYNRKSPLVRHEDLRDLLEEIEAELEGLQFEFPAPKEEIKSEPPNAGAPSASITTGTMFGGSDVIDNTVAEYHVDSVPASLPKHSGEIVKVVDSRGAYDADQQ